MWVSISMVLILAQLGIKSLGTRVSKAGGYRSRLSDSLSSGVAVCISECRYVVT